MSWVALILAALWLGDVWRLRGRLAKLPRLPFGPESAGADEADLSEWTHLLAPGAELSRHTLRAAVALAEEQGWEAVDLIPGDLPAEGLLGLLATYDPERWREDPFRPVRSAGQVLVVRRALVERCGLELTEGELPSLAAFLEAAGEIRRCTTRREASGHGSGLALAPGLRAGPRSMAEERTLFDAVVGRGAPFVLGAQGGVLALLLLTLVLAPAPGLIALLVFHLQPLLITAGRGAQPADTGALTLLRVPLTLWRWGRLVRAGSGEQRLALPEARSAYAGLLEGGTASFFEPRRTACPHCGGETLYEHLTTGDLYQQKPGTFTLERCGDCSLIFQNPRLSLEGLSFYYRDFYDGLGEAGMETIFGASLPAYHARAQALEGLSDPKRWLDVGGGHGHFCVIAREHFPGCRFEILDLADSVEAAKRRGWVDEGHRGLFPESAEGLGRYDVVSMSHYLEHVRDQEAEIEAAARVLPVGGHLMIEIPDPESKLPKLLGRHWIPFFQPQHQHFLAPRHVDELLQRHGFTPVRWARGSAHIPVDFFMASWILVTRLAGSPGRPWLPAPTMADWVRHDLVWALGFWLLPAGWIVDRVAERALRKGGWSNAFRVVARKDRDDPAAGE
ncbi:MAG: class I SAM-dependent methyltransferase [Deltaproteobacteria bacterium]|nr:class I SAM-dependent methyltransferase [Deltaproteobacteria bacterium]